MLPKRSYSKILSLLTFSRRAIGALCYLTAAAIADTGYIASKDGYIYTFDPTTMEPAKQFTTTSVGNALGLAINGATGYIAAQDGYIYTFDPTARGPATQLTTMSVGSTALGVAIHGTTGYIAAQDGCIYTFDPMTGDSVTQLTKMGIGGVAFGIAIEGSTGYIAARNGLIYTFDPVTGDPVAPLTTTKVGGNARGVAIDGATGYIAAQNGFIYTFDPIAGDPVTPLTKTKVGNAFGVAGVAIDGTTGYVATQDGYIYTFDPMAGDLITQLTTLTGATAGPNVFGIAIGPFTPTSSLSTTGFTGNSLILVAYLGAPTPFISTTGLTGNSLSLANYLNDNAPTSTQLLFASSTNLDRALKSASPVRNAITTFMGQMGQISFIQVLNRHWSHRNHPIEPTSQISSSLHEDILLVDNSSELQTATESISVEESPECQIEPAPPPFCKRFSSWLAGFGEYTNLQEQHQTPSVRSGSGGVVAAWDYYYGCLRLHSIGIAAAYAHTHLDQEREAGHADINQGALALYGTWSNSRWYCNTALWGGIYYNHNVRQVTVSTISGDAKSSTHGWQFTPHLEIGYHSTHVEPFVMADWVNCWENALREHGLADLNMGQKKRYCSLFRGETGLRFQETRKVCWGALLFREKLSYAYQKTFHTGTINAFLVGSPGSFTVSTLVGAQNLGVGEFEIFFAPNDPKRPHGSLSYEGQFGSRYQSHQLTVAIGKEF